MSIGSMYCTVCDSTTHCTGRHNEYMNATARNRGVHVPLPDGAGKLLNAAVFNGMLLIACEAGVFVRRESGVWQTVDVV